MAVDQKQLQLKSSEEKVKDLRRKLNAAASNREYQAFLEQIAADEMTNSVLTDEILERVEKSDAFAKNIAEAEAGLAAARQKTEQVRTEVAAQEPSLRADVARLEDELRQTEGGLPAKPATFTPASCGRREKTPWPRSKTSAAAAATSRSPLNLYSQIMLGQPVSCKTCGRLLYLPE